MKTEEVKEKINIKNQTKQEKGAISALVLFTVLMFVTILMSVFITVGIRQKSGLKSNLRVAEVYGEDVDKIEEIYNNLISKEPDKPHESNGKYAHPYIPEGFEYTEGEWNTGFVIKETSTGNEFVWVPCVLNQEEVEEGDTVVTYQKITTGKYNTRQYPLLPTDTSVPKDDFTSLELKASVGKYQGFYIARYEAGIAKSTDNDTLTTKIATDGSVKPLSQSGKGVWNSISRTDALTVSKAMVSEAKTGVKTTLITGEAWDTTLAWVTLKDNTYAEDSANKGWYSDVSSNKVRVTGYYKTNNIYDLGGNIQEYTTENCLWNSQYLTVIRGGGYDNSSTNQPAANRGHNTDTANKYVGFRPVLYKKNEDKDLTIEDLRGTPILSEVILAKDSNDNKIKIPKGFKVAEDSGINVTEGIVIEDNDIKSGIGNNRGNQYVWVPVGNGIKKNDGTTVDITLGRYSFANGTSDKDSNGTLLAKGTPILQQNSENYTQEVLINSQYKELSMSRTGVLSSGVNGLNTTALNLKGFVDSVKANGGYYIARYEASYGTDGKANSKVSNTYGTSSVNKEGQLWNSLLQLNAANASRGLYTTMTSDLINSYAWDTAIVYIQNFSGDTDYSYQNLSNSSLTNTGTTGDEVCKINDMASNTMEWTTEYCIYATSSNANPCTLRGGMYSNLKNTTLGRYGSYATEGYVAGSFRAILY